MCKSVQVLIILILSSLLSETTFAQATSEGKKSNDTIIACAFGRLQTVNFNVFTNGTKEILSLRHTDILVYENNRLQELDYFMTTQDKDMKEVGYRYTIGYYSDNTKEDGKFRKLKIVAKTKEGKRFKIQLSIKGYYATKGYFDY